MNLDGGLQLVRPSPYLPLPERARDLNIRFLAKMGGFHWDQVHPLAGAGTLRWLSQAAGLALIYPYATR